MSVQVSYKKQSVMGIFGIVIILLIIELVANVWWISQISCEFEDSEIFRDMSQDQKNQLCMDLYQIRTSGSEIIPNQSSNTININSEGFRGSEFSTIKEQNDFRIIMLGGSTMFGTGATSDDTTIPGYLQSFFDESQLDNKIEVINAGIQGADSNTELKLIENKLLQFSPDLVIIYDGWNDLRSNHTPTKLLTNWNNICELGKKYDFDTIISLQPLAGFANKSLTKQENEFSKTGLDYNDKLLINLLPVYDKYQENLSQLVDCSATINLRNAFDKELETIYWDQGHVSDTGNKIIAGLFYKNIFDIILEKLNSEKTFSTTTVNLQNNNLSKDMDVFRDIISNYKTPIMISDLFSFKSYDEISIETPTQEISLIETNSMLYDEREISIFIEFSPSNFLESDSKIIKIFAYDNTNEIELENVTYFLSIFKNNENLLREYFYVQNKFLTIEINSVDSESIKLSGDKQYDHNAYIMKDDPLIITGPIFLSSGNYEFKFDLRTIDESSNWIFNLDEFETTISIKD